MGFSATASAEEQEVQNAQQEKKTLVELPQWVKNIKFSGYAMLQYQGEDKEGSHSNTFNLRLARFILDGKIGDFDWRAQIQGTNATGPGQPTVQLVDLYAEWRKYPEFKVRAGQFKRAFTFENPTNPITQGWRGYADAINKLSAFGDRTGERSSGGRDIGIQLSGDLFPNANGRRVFHYQIGVYNGEGVNQKDMDNRKDIIAGVWVMPIKGLRIGAFGWTGSRGEMVDSKLIDPVTKQPLQSMTRTNTPSVLSISTVRAGVQSHLATTYARSTTRTATRPTVGTCSASCPSSRESSMPRLVTRPIATRKNGAAL